MSDEDENEEAEAEFHLDPGEVEEVVMWAIHAASTITLMHHHPEHDNDKEALERLEGYIQALEMMYNDLPTCIIEVSHDVASSIIEEAEANEAIVEEFVEQIKDL